MPRSVALLVAALALSCGGGGGETAEPAVLLPALPADPAGGAAGLVDFGRVEFGRYTRADVLLENGGAAALVVEAPAVPPPFFADVRPSGLAVPAGGVASLSLGFAPVSVGPAEALVLFRAGDVELSLRLRGEGTPPGPCLLAATPVDFGVVPAATRVPGSVEVHAAGDGPCLLEVAGVEGAGFEPGPGPVRGVTLRPGGPPLPVGVVFAPPAAGSYRGTLRVVAGAASVEVALTGAAVAD